MTFTYIFYPIVIILYMLCIHGYGKLFSKIFCFEKATVNTYKNLDFCFGLILVGFFSLMINLLSNLRDNYSVIIISIGFLIYLFFFKNNSNKKNEIYNILFITLIAFFFSFYSLSNDDFFGYHLKTIINFKDYKSFDIPHDRTTSYNSHWLLINSVFFLKNYPASIFCITSIFYATAVLDFFNSVKRNRLNKNYLASIFSFLCLIFFIGVLNQYKDFGTDFPGQIVLFYLILIFFEKKKLIILNKENNIFILLVFLAFFSFTIKIYNGLIFIFLFLIFIQLKNRIYVLVLSLFSSIPLIFWFVQNYIISKCLVWPLTFLCFSNLETSRIELRMIEQFAKGDMTLSFNIVGLNWVNMWFTNHFYKLIETYALYIFIILLPPLILYFKINFSEKSIYLKEIKNCFYELITSYKSYIFFLLVSNIIWFIFIPAYRFGIFFNLNAIIFFLIPFWFKIISSYKDYYFKSVRIIIYIAIVFFVFENISKYNDYYKRHGIKWPNIEQKDLNL